MILIIQYIVLYKWFNMLSSMKNAQSDNGACITRFRKDRAVIIIKMIAISIFPISSIVTSIVTAIGFVVVQCEMLKKKRDVVEKQRIKPKDVALFILGVVFLPFTMIIVGSISAIFVFGRLYKDYKINSKYIMEFNLVLLYAERAVIWAQLAVYDSNCIVKLGKVGSVDKIEEKIEEVLKLLKERNKQDPSKSFDDIQKICKAGSKRCRDKIDAIQKKIDDLEMKIYAIHDIEKEVVEKRIDRTEPEVTKDTEDIFEVKIVNNNPSAEFDVSQSLHDKVYKDIQQRQYLCPKLLAISELKGYLDILDISVFDAPQYTVGDPTSNFYNPVVNVSHDRGDLEHN